VDIDEEEARKPMGITKKQHIQELLDLPEVAAQLPDGATVDSMYEGEGLGSRDLVYRVW
jgi:hypothetical protein